jgi:hypothetical protein
MAPFADNVNHSDAAGYHEFINIEHHIEKDESSSYFNDPVKFMTDVSQIYDGKNNKGSYD